MAKKNKEQRKKHQKYPVGSKCDIPKSKDSWGVLDMIDPEKELDLHGCDMLNAEMKTEQFISEAINNNQSKIRIITGKGLHSEYGYSVLRIIVEKILKKLDLDYKDAGIWNGGSGAIDIKLV
jgi:DNA-nicking Smr family endonuclease